MKSEIAFQGGKKENKTKEMTKGKLTKKIKFSLLFRASHFQNKIKFVSSIYVKLVQWKFHLKFQGMQTVPSDKIE